MSSQSATEPKWLTPTVDYGPLVAFFAVYFVTKDLLTATAVLIAATLVALVLSLAVRRKVPLMPVITAGIVAVFGGLTLWLEDETFIKMKPTIIQALFAAVLLGGLAFGRPLLKPLLGPALPPMAELGWRQLTLRYGLFFIAMALLNEVVWRTQSTDFWVTFKVFGIIGLTLAFGVAQMPLINRHKLPEPAAGS